MLPPKTQLVPGYVKGCFYLRNASILGLILVQVMVVGPSDAGKTSLCKILLSYAFKNSHQPLYVDLDPSEVSLQG